MQNLLDYGADERLFTFASSCPGLSMARVVSQSREIYQIMAEGGETLAEVSGKFRFEATSPAAYPAVGDFVMVAPGEGTGAHATIHQVLPRRSAFVRKAAGETGNAQVVAANIDIAFICMALNQNYNLSRLERYLAVAWESGATPVVVLTKADLCENLPAVLAEVAPVALGAEVLVTRADDPAGLQAVRDHLKAGVTATFIGSSGVGKSTLINALLGEAKLSTSGVGADGRGHHTTTHRELILLPQGGVVIDTPGMRELGVEAADLRRSFADIDALAEGCRFGDCTHGSEPGCAVRAALMAGTLDARRLESYQKLRRETRYDGLNSRQREGVKIDAMFGGKKAMKQMRDAAKHKAGGR